MLEIKLCLDRTKLSEWCKDAGHAYSEAFYAYVAENRGQELAVGLFNVSSDYVEVVWYRSQDNADVYLFDGVLRAGFHYADDQGIEQGSIPEDFRRGHRQAFDKLNYPVSELFNIVNFFAKYKNCADPYSS